jgi:hypothetical protein
MLLGFFARLGVPWLRYGVYFAAAALVAVALRQMHSSIYTRGWNDALAVVAQENAEAADAARKTQTTVDQCWNTGGRWDVRTGSCTR